jgi:hypothetical protein
VVENDAGHGHWGWVRLVCVRLNTSAFDVTRWLSFFVGNMDAPYGQPDGGLLVSTVWLSGVSGEMIQRLRT